MNLRASLVPCRALSFLIAFALAAGEAFGQTAPGPEPPRVATDDAVTPPRPERIVEPEYPPDAQASRIEAVLVLRLTIDANGDVKAAEVVERSAEGFDDAARAAILKSHFSPATKAGKPVAAKILFRSEFRLPPEAPAEPGPAGVLAAPPAEATAAVPPRQPAAKSATAPKVPPPPAAKDSPQEVTIEGERSDAQTVQRSAAPVTVVELRQHKKRSSDLGEVMARTFGVSVRRAGGLGSDTRFSLNGLQEEQLRFFINGIPLEHSYPGHIANIPINLLERVELYRGVVPVKYASDALGGVVNIVTSDSFENRLGGSYELGSFATRRATAIGRYRDPDSGLSLGVEGFIDGAKNDYEVDVEVPDDRGRLHPATVPRFHDRYRAYGVFVDAGFTEVPWAKRLVLRGLSVAYDKQLQNNTVMSVPYGEVVYGEQLKGLQLTYQHTFLSRLDVEVLGSYAHNTTDFSDQGPWVYDWYGQRVRARRVPGEIEGKPSDSTVWQKSAFGRVGFLYRFTDQHRLRLATSSDYVTRTGDERIQLDPNARDPLTAKQDLYKQVTGLEYELRAFHLPGRSRMEDSDGRVEHLLENIAFVKHYVYHVDAEEPLPGNIMRARDQRRLRFGVGDGVRVLLTEYLYAKASYELTTRMPRSDEVFGDGILVHANVELTPEISDNANLGARLELEDTPAGEVMVDVNGFFRDTQDQIVLLGNDRFYTYQNVYRAVSKGVEGAFEWIFPGRIVACDGSFTYTDQRNQSDEGPFTGFKGDRLPNRPWLQGSLGARLRFTQVFDHRDEFEPFYTARYVHEYYRGWESVGLKQYKQVIPSQLIQGAGVTYTIRRNEAVVHTTLEVQNFADQKAYDFYGVERPGRAFFMKVVAVSN